MTGIVKTDQIQGAGSSTVTIPSGTALNVTTVSGTPTFSGDVTLPSINGGQIGGRRNIIINGAMQIAQRSTSETGKGDADGYFTLDRFRMGHGAASAGRYTMSRSTVTDLEGFSNALKIDCTTADTSIAAGEALLITQRLEGFNLQQLKATSTSTRAFTVSFYAKSNASRAIASEITFTNGTNRQISKLHTIGTSWARYTMTVPAASSTQIDNDNSHEGDLNFWIHAGSTYSSGTINDDALDSITNANRAVGIGSIFASTDNTLEITGVQLELGETATAFEHRSYGEDLQLCKRYFERITGQFGTDGTSSFVLGGGVWYSTTQVLANFQYDTKRASPTTSVSQAGAMKAYGPGYARTANDTTCFDQIAENNARINISPFTSTGTAGYGTLVQMVANETIDLDAEL